MTDQRLQRILIDACCSERPAAALQDLSALHAAELDEHEHEFLRAVDHEALLITAMLGRRRRLDRVIDGDTRLLVEFQTDPEGFTQEFVEYADTVSPTHWRPRDEARAYRDFVDLLG